MTDSRFWAVVPAAGVGKRMQADIPKQYLLLNDRPVIEHTLQRLLQHPAISGAYVALGVEDGWWPDTAYAQHPDVVRVDGGAERCHSVLNALDALSQQAADDDWVLVHDAARPCVRQADLDALIACAESTDIGALLGMPVKDTMKRTDAEGVICKTVDRDNLWHAFTPQMFRLGFLRDCLQRALDSGVLVTDEASAVERVGYRPLMVEGHADNLKITRPEDLSLASYYLNHQA